jgi:hypothetical protein
MGEAMKVWRKRSTLIPPTVLGAEAISAQEVGNIDEFK